MATTIQTHAREFVRRNGAASRLGRIVPNHRTLCIGILYIIAISAVLALVAKLQ